MINTFLFVIFCSLILFVIYKITAVFSKIKNEKTTTEYFENYEDPFDDIIKTQFKFQLEDIKKLKTKYEKIMEHCIELNNLEGIERLKMSKKRLDLIENKIMLSL